MTNLKSVREQILKQRGLTTTREAIDKHKKLISAVGDLPLKKTAMMQLLELRHKDSIVDILASGSLSCIEKKYKIDRTTASKWRKSITRQLLMMLAKEEVLGNKVSAPVSRVEASSDNRDN